ncbi:M15 family metallopeptidase [uncultured Mucilaginibacter sp.]|uniref:M15 family metallopeptidase n=1 Tax=uncultured Mucilaginibacter sp. TaxID=797541 RepID=UPI0025CE41B1|nr:M15 family metallopeptidase [uncultured Mucilaginibacter sp.]
MDIRSLNALTTLHPKFRPSAIAAWTEAQAKMPANVQIIVIQGLRTFQQSNADYAQGRTAPGEIITKAPAGESYHNYGLAFDFAMVTNGKDDYVVGPHWMQVVSIMEKYGVTWGGNFSGLKDSPHFENKYGHNWRDLLAKHNAGDFIPGTTFVNI